MTWLILVLSLSACSTWAADRLLLTVPLHPAGAEGVVRWESAPLVTGFRLVHGGALAALQTDVQVLYDESALRVRYCCPLPNLGLLRAAVRERDGPVWRDDSVELFLDPEGTGLGYFHFIVNCVGSQYDAKNGDATWDGDWSCAVGRDEDLGAWTCELTIPFATLGRHTPRDGEVWGANFCRNSASEAENSSWAYTPGFFAQPELFGALVFRHRVPAVRLGGVRDVVVGAGEIVIGASGGEVSFQLRVDKEGAEAFKVERTLTAPDGRDVNVAVPIALTTQGVYTLQAKAVAADGTLLLFQRTPFLIRDPVVLSVRPFFFSGVAEVTVDVRGLPASPERLRAELLAVGRDNVPVDRAKLEGLPGGKGVREMSLGAQSGPVRFMAEVFSGGRTRLGGAQATVDCPPRPEWLGTHAGLSDQVLPPFQPLRAYGEVVEIWGRRLNYRNRLLPASIVSQGEELLAAPISLTLRADGNDVPLTLTARVGKSSDLVHFRTCEETCGLFEFRGEQTVEYDGCIKAKVELEPTVPLTVDQYTLDIPLRTEVAKYLHACNGEWDRTRSGSIPKTGWRSDFVPYVWIGDEDRGLAWFTESDAPFSIASPGSALEIAHEEGRSTLRVHLIDRPTHIQDALTITFGLQPTPVKPVPARKPRVWHGAYYGMETDTVAGEASLQYPAAGNIDLRQGTLEIVATLDFDPQIAAQRQQNHSLFRLRRPNGDQAFLFWDYHGYGMWFYVGLGPDYPQTYPIHIRANRLPWTRGETHHIALTWGSRTVMYLDGQEAAISGMHEGWMPGELRDEVMAFGSNVAWDRADWIIHSLRISSEPLPPEELAANAARVQRDGPKAWLPAGDHTLLLHHPHALEDGSGLNSPQQIVTGEPRLVGQAAARADGVACGGSQALTVLDKLKQAGVEVLVFHDTWTDHIGYPRTPHAQELRSLIAACHDRGMKLVLYFGYGLGNMTPEMSLYHDEWTVWPLISWNGGRPERSFDAACNNSQLPLFLLDGIDKLADEFDIDGVYLDGTARPLGCTNRYHGCGYVADDGRRPTYPIWATRDFIRRLCTIFRQKRKDPLVIVHASATVTIPTLGFCDIYWDGEQFAHYVHGQRDPRSLLPLDTFRAEFMGRQYGLHPEFLVYNGRPFTNDEALAIALLHNVLMPPRGLGAALEKVSAIWRAQDEFGTSEVEFLPYWSNGQVVRVEPEGIYVSAWRRQDRGLLMVVSNLGRSEVDARVTLQAETLAGTEYRAWDALNQEPIPINGGALSFRMGPMTWRLLRIGR